MIERLLFLIAGIAIGSLIAKSLMNRPKPFVPEYKPTHVEYAVAQLMQPEELRLGAFMHATDDAVFVTVKEQQPS